MLHAGLDLSRNRIDVCLLSDAGEIVEEFKSPADLDGLSGLVRRVDRHRQPVRAVVESMTGARFVHDTLERRGWDVFIADAQKAKGLAPLTCKTDKTDARVLAVLSERCLVPEIWLPDPSIRRERELARFRLHLVKHRSMLKHRIHSTLINFGQPCPVTDLFGLAGRQLLQRLDLDEPWRQTSWIRPFSGRRRSGLLPFRTRRQQSRSHRMRGAGDRSGPPALLFWARLSPALAGPARPRST
jgi:transposase